MDISVLKQEILDKKIRPFYVFTGDELALQDIYINKVSEVSGLPVVRATTLQSIYSTLTTKTLIKREPSLYVIRNDDAYIKSEVSWDFFINAKSLKDNILILLYTNIEKSSSFYKKHDSVITEFDFIGASILTNRLIAVTHMPAQYCADIVNMCGCNYGRIRNELYKLAVLTKVNGYSWNTAYLEAKKMNMIHEEIGDVIFEFTNAIVDRDIKKAYVMYDKVMQTDDGHNLKLITVLYNSFRQILMVQSTSPTMRTEQCLGMTNGQIYITNQKCNKYNLFELVDIVKTLRYLEKGIKLGTIAEDYAMEYFMGHIW